MLLSTEPYIEIYTALTFNGVERPLLDMVRIMCALTVIDVIIKNAWGIFLGRADMEAS